MSHHTILESNRGIIMIPSIGSQLRTTHDFAFTIDTKEYRNTAAVEAFNHAGILHKKTVTLPAETILEVQRIYIRRAAADYDSITLKVLSSTTKGIEKKRFWVSLAELNAGLQCEWDPATVPGMPGQVYWSRMSTLAVGSYVFIKGTKTTEGPALVTAISGDLVTAEYAHGLGVPHVWHKQIVTVTSKHNYDKCVDYVEKRRADAVIGAYANVREYEVLAQNPVEYPSSSGHNDWTTQYRRHNAYNAAVKNVEQLIALAHAGDKNIYSAIEKARISSIFCKIHDHAGHGFWPRGQNGLCRILQDNYDLGQCFNFKSLSYKRGK
jgi:hypothetical protein